MLKKIGITFTLGAIALLALAPSAPAQVKKSGNGYLFRVAYKKGQNLKLTTVTSYSSTGMNVSGDAKIPVDLKVLSVDSKGIATVKSTVGPAVMGGKSNGKPQVYETKLDRQNRPVGNSTVPGGEALGSLAFPDKAIAIGKTWNGTTSSNMGGANITLNVTYKLVGIKNVGGQQVAVIATTFKGSGMATFTGSGTTLVRVSDGTLQSTTYKLKASMSQGGGKPMSIDINGKVTRTK